MIHEVPQYVAKDQKDLLVGRNEMGYQEGSAGVQCVQRHKHDCDSSRPLGTSTNTHVGMG